MNDGRCNNIGQSQVRGRHFASHDIRERLKELKSLHEELLLEVGRKGKLLQEALSIHTFLSEVRCYYGMDSCVSVCCLL